MLRRFNMQDAMAVTTPMNTAENLSKDMSPKTSEIRGTRRAKSKYSAVGDSKLVSYSDVNWMSNLDDR